MNAPARLGWLKDGRNRDLLQIKVSGVYSVTNTATGRRYIGSSLCIGQRWTAHRSQVQGHYPGTVSPIGQDALSLGVEAFAFDLLEIVPADEDALEQAERRWITYFATCPGGVYNVEMTGRRPRRRRPSPQPSSGE